MGHMSYYLVIAIVIFLFLLFVLFMYLFLKTFNENRLDAYKQAYGIKYSTNMYKYLVTGEASPHLIPDSPKKFIAIEEMLNTFIKTINGNTITEKISAYMNIYFVPHYKKMLKSNHLSHRLNVLYKIFDFKLNTLIDDMIELYTSAKRLSREEYMQIYINLAVFQHNYLLDVLLSPKITINRTEYRQILYELEEDLISNLSNQYPHLHIDLKFSLIRDIGYKNMLKLVPFLVERLYDENLEIRIRALKSLSQVGYEVEEHIILPFVYSEIWEERMLAAKYLGSTNYPNTLIYLHNLIRDSSWWVRRNAAHAINRQRDGIEVLENIIRFDDDDKFSQDVAEEFLGKDLLDGIDIDDY